MRYVFFINPVAGKGKIQDAVANSIRQFFEDREENWKIHFTKSMGDARETAKKEAQTGEKIRMFACGGEGTVYEVLNGIIGYNNVELGVFPCGSANDFLKYFGSKETFLDVEAQFFGECVKMDLIKANDKYCLNGCSVGMDAMVAHDMILFKNWPLVSGPLAYKLAIAKTFFRSKIGISAEISVDDAEKKNHDCLFAVVANAPYYGGGYKSAPDAVPHDQKLDFTLVDTISKLRAPKFLQIYEKGLHTALDYCHLKKCETMEFWAKKAIPVNLDGEIVEAKHMRFSIVKEALNFVVPKGIKVNLLTNI